MTLFHAHTNANKEVKRANHVHIDLERRLVLSCEVRVLVRVVKCVGRRPGRWQFGLRDADMSRIADWQLPGRRAKTTRDKCHTRQDTMPHSRDGTSTQQREGFAEWTARAEPC